jgi:hypothetical protein
MLKISFWAAGEAVQHFFRCCHRPRGGKMPLREDDSFVHASLYYKPLMRYIPFFSAMILNILHPSASNEIAVSSGTYGR